MTGKKEILKSKPATLLLKQSSQCLPVILQMCASSWLCFIFPQAEQYWVLSSLKIFTIDTTKHPSCRMLLLCVDNRLR